MVYKLKWYLFPSCFLTISFILCQIPRLLRQYSPSCVCCIPAISSIQASVGCFYPFSTRSLRELCVVHCELCIVHCALQNREREGNTRLGGRRKSFAQVCAKLFWCIIYCANPRPEPNYQLGSLSHG